MALHPDELRADFQRFYRIDSGDIGKGCGWSRAASLLVALPPESMVRRALGDGWSTAERMLASVEFSLRVLRWYQTEDGAKGVNAPRFLESPNELADIAEHGHTKDEIADLLGIPEDRR